MAEFLFEIMHENIPHEIKNTSLKKWDQAFHEVLKSHSIQGYSFKSYITNSRIITVVENMPIQIQKESTSIRGPREGTDQSIVDKFLNKHKQTKDSLYVSKGFYNIDIKYDLQHTAELIPIICNKVIELMKWNKVSFWGEKLGWIRPVRRIVSIFNNSALLWHNENFGITSSSNFMLDFVRKTEFTANNFESYKNQLESHNIYLDNKLDKLYENVQNILNENSQQNINKAELQKISSQTESLNLYYSKIEDNFDIPVEIKKEVLEEQQHIGLFENNMLTGLIIFSEYPMSDNGDLLIAQTKKTLFSKLNDALFFWERDMSQDLNSYFIKLENTLFYNGLGTLKQKSTRVLNIAKQFNNNENLLKSIDLIQIDLCMQTITEMNKLEGLMSYFYCKHHKVSKEVCDIILAQYNNQNHTVNSLYLSLLFKLDSVIAFIGKKMTPTGSADPLAIRRKCMEIIKTSFMLHELGFSINIPKHIECFQSEFEKQNITLDLSDFKEYFHKRFTHVLETEYGSIAQLVFNEQDICLAKEKLESIKKFKEVDTIVKIYNRLNGLDYNDLSQQIISNLDATEQILVDFLEDEMNLDNLLAVSKQIEDIFTNHIINEELQLKFLLKNVRDKFTAYADFGKLK